MQPAELQINERATGVLYHYTSVRAALNILKTGQFELSSSVGATAEEKHMPRGYPYFLSTTRSRVGDYHRTTGNTGVMLVLDGDYFNRLGLKVRPVDYWERSWDHPDSGRSSESEDRVYSKNSTIPAKNIRQVHVLIRTQDDLRSAQIRQLLIAAKQSGIDAYLYKDEKDWRTQNRQRALPVKDALELLRGREPADRRTKGRNYLGQWLELVYKKSTGELSDRAKYVMRNLLIYNRGHGDDDMQLAVDLSNARKPGDQNRETAIRIIELLKKYDLDTKKFVQMLYHKWYEIDSKKESIGEASGYIPNNGQEAQDPRWSSAITADVRPGETQRQANKFDLELDNQGRPQLLMKDIKNIKEAAPPPRTTSATYHQISDLMSALGDVPKTELKQQFLQMARNILNLESDDPSWALGELTRRALGLHKARYSQTTWQWLSDLIKLKYDLNIGYQKHPDAANIEREVNDFLGNRGLYRYPIGEDLQDPKDNPCWSGYHPVGTKKKNGRTVPNCVPNESVNEGYQLDESLLAEIKMAPGDLRKWVDSAEAEGIVSGFEAELIFRDAMGETDEEEYEPDYDQDERARSIDQVIDFFQGGENGISSRTAERLSTALQEEYLDWQSEIINDAWEDSAEEQVRDYMEENVWPDEKDQYRERAAEELGFDVESDDAEQSQKIDELSRKMFDEEIERELEEQGRYYNEAQETFADYARGSSDYDEEAFLDDRYRYMSDIESAHGLDWPYWRGGESSNSGNRSPEGIADSLRRVLGGAEVRAGGGYHSTARKPGRWIIEPDGSLEPDDESSEAGLEIVSPPLPLKETLEKLDQVLEWANGDGDAYTNSSTGLHMGVSVPYKGGSVDYVKLVLFLGDQYVLDRFGRASNSYTASAMEKLQQNIRAKRNDTVYASRRVDPVAAMELMKKGLVELADRYVQDSVGESKYTSAHIKDGYIEFRSPGGDYLSADSQEIGILRDTMLRFARAMHIASRPDLERKEYSKKLYKLLTGFRGAETAKTGKDTKYRTEIKTEGVNDALELFAKFSTGMINSEELKKQWAEQVLSKEQPVAASQDWEVIDAEGNVKGIVQAADLDRAKWAVRTQYDDWLYLDVRLKQDKPSAEKKLSRRAEIAKRLKERPSIWRVTDTNTGKTIVVAASDTRSAKFQAADSGGEHWKVLRANDPDSMLVEPASAAEVKQYQEKMADQQQDSAQVQQRVQAPSIGGYSMYRVRWTEQRNGQDHNDSLRVSAANADSAMASVRSALEAQGREVVTINAVLADSTEDRAQQRAQQSQQAANQREYQIYLRSSNFPLIGFRAANDEAALARLDQYRQQHPTLDVGVRTGGGTSITRQQPQQSFTGEWDVLMGGQPVFRVRGETQSIANQAAREWLSQRSPEFNQEHAGQELEVVPRYA